MNAQPLSQAAIRRLYAAKQARGGARMASGARSRSKTTVDLADTLLAQIRALRLPEPIREYRPWTDRKFRIDLAYVDRKIFIEVDGGEWANGRHSRGAGMQTDCIKWNRLTLEGWSGYRFTGSMVRSGAALALLEQVVQP